ncbi:hypothetical protein NQ315_013326 [Exocentrus adspersus]|uniref:Tyr recombinase domain-containing protein n=1 Tax=Exocentrus adspersus TaxID=1586481 RepID=A0AAV8V758_9CUCU|nr:hypothetical protein NQ315_013326 [Exocentrus adspersus]
MYAESSKWCFVSNCGNTSINAVTLPSTYVDALTALNSAALKRSSFFTKEIIINIFTRGKLFEVAFTKSLEVILIDALIEYVALIFGVAGACRGKELHQLTISDLTDMDHALLVNVRNTKNNVDRNFIINNSNKNGIDLIEVCRKYMALRKPETTHSRFFVRTSASLLTDSGASIDVLKRHCGWKSASVAEGYIENSINTKKIVADSIFGLGVGNSTESSQMNQEWNDY